MASNPSGRGPSCNFGDYLVPRIADMPKFAGHVVSGADAATGIGDAWPAAATFDRSFAQGWRRAAYSGAAGRALPRSAVVDRSCQQIARERKFFGMAMVDRLPTGIGVTLLAGDCVA